MRILHGHEDTVRCVSYAPQGRYLATGDEDGALRLWDLSSGKEVHNFIHGSSVEALAFSFDGRWLIAGTADGPVVLHDPRTGERAKGAATVVGGVRSLAPAPDRPLVAVLGWHGTSFLCELPTRRMKPLAPVGKESCVALAFQPGGTLLAAATAGSSVLLVDMATNKVRASVQASAPVVALAFAPDGRLLAAGDGQGGVTLWDVAARKAHPLPAGHSWTVYGVGFTPCGKRLVTGSADGTVRLWDVQGRRMAEAFRWHTRWVTCVAVAPDGMTAAAGSEDHTVVVWDLPDD